MKGCEWIVCESSCRWASAMRMALEGNSPAESRVRLYETRLLKDLAARLAERPDSFAAVEIRAQNAGEALAWIAAATGRFGRARFVALLDCGILSGRAELEAALREAGAIDVISSPRLVHKLLDLVGRHAALANRAAERRSAHRTLEEQVWELLPWQAAATRVG